MRIVYNVITLLFLFLLGLLTGGYYGYLLGQEFYNKYLVVSAWNSGYTQGYTTGSTNVFYTLFEDYVKQNPYKLDKLGRIKNEER